MRPELSYFFGAINSFFATARPAEVIAANLETKREGYSSRRN
jgi:hypothetical protein